MWLVGGVVRLRYFFVFRYFLEYFRLRFVGGLYFFIVLRGFRSYIGWGRGMYGRLLGGFVCVFFLNVYLEVVVFFLWGRVVFVVY